MAFMASKDIPVGSTAKFGNYGGEALLWKKVLGYGSYYQRDIYFCTNVELEYYTRWGGGSSDKVKYGEVMQWLNENSGFTDGWSSLDKSVLMPGNQNNIPLPTSQSQDGRIVSSFTYGSDMYSRYGILVPSSKELGLVSSGATREKVFSGITTGSYSVYDKAILRMIGRSSSMGVVKGSENAVYDYVTNVTMNPRILPIALVNPEALFMEESGGTGAYVPFSYDFTGRIKVQTKVPLEADAMPKLFKLNASYQNATKSTKFEVCNNGYDEEPTWEDVTEYVNTGNSFLISNESKTSDKWGVGIRATLEQDGNTDPHVSLSSITGNFE